MSEEGTGAAGAQGATTAAGEAIITPPATIGQGQGPATGAGAASGGEPSTASEQAGTQSQDETKRLHDEAAKHRVRAREVEQQLATVKAEHEKQLATVTTQKDAEIMDLRVRGQIVSEAVRLGFQVPDTAVKLIDRSEIKVEDGNIVGVSEALAKLAKEQPYLLAPRATKDAGATGAGVPAQGVSEQIRRSAGVI